MEQWVSVSKIAELTQNQKRAIRRRAEQESWEKKLVYGNGGQQYRYRLASLPEDIQEAYARSIQTTLEALKKQLEPTIKLEKKAVISRYSGRGAKTYPIKPLEKIPHKNIEIGTQRLALLELWSDSGLTVEQFITGYRNGVIAADLKAKLGFHGNIETYQSFYRWLERYEQYGLAGLCPQYESRRGGSGASLDEDCKDILQSLFLDKNKPSYAQVHRDIRQFGYTLSYPMVVRYLTDLPNSVKTYFRDGPTKYHDKFDPYLKRDYTKYRSMEWASMDHRNADVVLNVDGKLYRPWITRIDDMRSRMILGWHIDLVPSTLTILHTLYKMVTDYGLVEHLIIDNGKDFKSEWLAGSEWKEKHVKVDMDTLVYTKGVYHDLGMTIHFAQPYRGQSKPIERAWRTDHELFDKYFDTYVGSNTVTRPEESKEYYRAINGKEKKLVEMTMEEFTRLYENFVTWFNTCWEHSGDGMNGRTPQAVFEENLSIRRLVPDERLKFIFARRNKCVIQRRGVTIDGIEYYAPELARYKGDQVEVRRDIRDSSKVYIFSLPEVKYLCEAYNNMLSDTGATEDDIRRVRKAQAAERKHLNEYAKARKEIKKIRKSPAEILAEQALEKQTPAYPDDQIIQVVNGGIVIPDQMGKTETGKVITMPHAKRKLKLPFDPD